MTKLAKHICMYCDKDLGDKEVEVPECLKDDEPITHGLCKECYDYEMAKFYDVVLDVKHQEVCRKK